MTIGNIAAILLILAVIAGAVYAFRHRTVSTTTHKGGAGSTSRGDRGSVNKL